MPVNVLKKKTTKKMANYDRELVHCKTQEQWDFVVKILKRDQAGCGWKLVGDSIDLSNPNSSFMYNIHQDKKTWKFYSFDEWCKEFGHKYKGEDDLSGRYLKALVSSPDYITIIKKDDVVRIKDKNTLEKIGNYEGLTYTNIGSNWELLPSDYYPAKKSYPVVANYKKGDIVRIVKRKSGNSTGVVKGYDLPNGNAGEICRIDVDNDQKNFTLATKDKGEYIGIFDKDEIEHYSVDKPGISSNSFEIKMEKPISFNETKIWIGDNPDLSSQIQNIIFKKGFSWSGKDTTIRHTSSGSLYFEGNTICHMPEHDRKKYFDVHSHREIFPADIGITKAVIGTTATPIRESSSEELTEFPTDGYCKTRDLRLKEFLNKRFDFSKSIDHKVIGMAWGLTGWWTVSLYSSKPTYELAQLEKFLPKDPSTSYSPSGAKFPDKWVIRVPDGGYIKSPEVRKWRRSDWFDAIFIHSDEYAGKSPKSGYELINFDQFMEFVYIPKFGKPETPSKSESMRIKANPSLIGRWLKCINPTSGWSYKDNHPKAGEYVKIIRANDSYGSIYVMGVETDDLMADDRWSGDKEFELMHEGFTPPASKIVSKGLGIPPDTGVRQTTSGKPLQLFIPGEWYTCPTSSWTYKYVRVKTATPKNHFGSTTSWFTSILFDRAISSDGKTEMDISKTLANDQMEDTMEYVDEATRKSFMKPPFTVGKWYKYVGDSKKYMAKAFADSRVDSDSRFWHGDWINEDGVLTTKSSSNTHLKWNHGVTTECTSEEIQKFLPDGHVDKISVDVKTVLMPGKWYYGSSWVNKSCCKFTNTEHGLFNFNESFYDNKYSKDKGYWGICPKHEIVPQEELDKFLPEGHPDRTKITWAASAPIIYGTGGGLAKGEIYTMGMDPVSDSIPESGSMSIPINLKEEETMGLFSSPKKDNQKLLDYAAKNYNFGDKLKRSHFEGGNTDTVNLKQSDYPENDIPHFNNEGDMFMGMNQIYCGRSKTWAKIIEKAKPSTAKSLMGKKVGYMGNVTTVIGYDNSEDGVIVLRPDGWTVEKRNSIDYRIDKSHIGVSKAWHTDIKHLDLTKVSTGSRISTKSVGKVVLPPIEIKERRKTKK